MLPFSNSTHASQFSGEIHSPMQFTIILNLRLRHDTLWSLYCVGLCFPKKLIDLFHTLRSKDSYPGAASRKGGMSDTHNQVQTLFVMCKRFNFFFFKIARDVFFSHHCKFNPHQCQCQVGTWGEISGATLSGWATHSLQWSLPHTFIFTYPCHITLTCCVCGWPITPGT